MKINKNVNTLDKKTSLQVMKFKLPKEMTRLKSKDNLSKKFFRFLILKKFILIFLYNKILGSNISRLKTQDNSPNPKYLSIKKSENLAKNEEFRNSPIIQLKKDNNDGDFKIDLKSNLII